MFANDYVTFDFALAREPQVIVCGVRRKLKTPFFHESKGSNVAFDFDGAGAARSQSAAMNQIRWGVVQRHALLHQRLAQVGPFHALEGTRFSVFVEFDAIRFV